MNYQAFDQFQFDVNEEEGEITSQDIDQTLQKEKAKKSSRDGERESIGYYTHSFKPSVKKTILTGDDFIPMARVKIDKEIKPKTVGNGKKTSEKNQSKEKKQSKAQVTKEDKAKKQSRNNKSINATAKVGSTKEATPKKSAKAVKASKSEPFDILHKIIDSGNKIKPSKNKKVVVKKTQPKLKSPGKKSQIERNLEKQLKTTLETLVQTTFNRFLSKLK